MPRVLISVLILSALGGCQGGIYVPVYQAGEKRGADYYVVQRGDTLYSVAFRYGLDYKELAASNNIEPPYTIYVDQRIRLHPQRGTVVVDSGPVAKSESKVSSPPTPASPQGSTPKIISPPADDEIDWRWPYEGEVIAGFSLTGKVNKGIDIRGTSGEPVHSSADGVVVYAGGGLRGYGKLVIVKHNDRYLSAYGHNQSILVKEGDKVKRGQVVAKIGGPNGDKDLLHFEIRRDGKPEDPLRYLPARNT
ncbi:MAG: peptidoglycan DD-metalloendopeptidase family protein [Pseudomonadales bacterium]